MGEGNGNGKAPVLGLCMIQPFCFSESWIRMLFQVSGIFFGIRRTILPD